MKKLFAFALAFMFMCTYPAIGASASIPKPKEEDLGRANLPIATPEQETLGRQLLEETMAVLNSGRYTLKGIDSFGAEDITVCDGERIASMTGPGNRYHKSDDSMFNSSGLSEWVKIRLLRFPRQMVYGTVDRTICYPDKTQYIHSNRRFYLEVPENNLIYYRSPLPEEMPDELTVKAEGDLLIVSFDAGSKHVTYYKPVNLTSYFIYRNGMLTSWVKTPYKNLATNHWLFVERLDNIELSATSDERYFSTRFLRKADPERMKRIYSVVDWLPTKIFSFIVKLEARS